MTTPRRYYTLLLHTTTSFIIILVLSSVLFYVMDFMNSKQKKHLLGVLNELYGVKSLPEGYFSYMKDDVFFCNADLF